MGYRPHLDGLRAVAVYLVVLYHAGLDRASGGFLGVDVFFVLSGYLVTQLLMRDLVGGGSIRMGRFYSRRIRRLLPAAVLVLLVTMLVFPSVGSPAELANARDGVRAAALYVSNWFFIRQSSQYFAADIQASPVVHFWSLSVEEQFYLTWPVLLGGLHALSRRVGRWGWSLVQAVVLAGLVVSLGAALWAARTDLNRAYLGTDTRAYQLLAGALLALSPGALVRWQRLAGRGSALLALGALGALLVLASGTGDLDPVARGVGATVFTVALIVSLESHAGVVRSVLSLPPVVHLGRISYGTYLWHWLVILVTANLIDASPLSTALIAIAVATGLAAVSFELLERPVRQSEVLDRRRVGVIAVGLAASVAVAAIAAPRLLDLDHTRAVAVAPSTAQGTPVPVDLDWQSAQNDEADFPDCSAEAPDGCTLVIGTGAHVLLIGDSHAGMFIPMFTDLARDRSLTLSAAVAPVCPWQDGLFFMTEGVRTCIARHADWYPALIDRLDPDIVVVASRPFDDPTSPTRVVDESAGESPVDSSGYLDYVRARSEATIQMLRSAGSQVVIIEPVPVAPSGTDPLNCLSEATYVEECRFVSSDERTPVEEMYRSLADTDAGVWTIDLDRRVCPYLPICDPIVDGLIVKRDHGHLTTRFARTLRDAFEEFFDDNGLVA